MGRSVERAAKNEATFRRVNESLEEKAGELGLSEERTTLWKLACKATEGAA